MSRHRFKYRVIPLISYVVPAQLKQEFKDTFDPQPQREGDLPYEYHPSNDETYDKVRPHSMDPFSDASWIQPKDILRG